MTHEQLLRYLGEDAELFTIHRLPNGKFQAVKFVLTKKGYTKVVLGDPLYANTALGELEDEAGRYARYREENGK